MKCVPLLVVKQIEQDVVARSVNRIIRATNPKPKHSVLGAKRFVLFRPRRCRAGGRARFSILCKRVVLHKSSRHFRPPVFWRHIMPARLPRLYELCPSIHNGIAHRLARLRCKEH